MYPVCAMCHAPPVVHYNIWHSYGTTICCVSRTPRGYWARHTCYKRGRHFPKPRVGSSNLPRASSFSSNLAAPACLSLPSLWGLLWGPLRLVLIGREQLLCVEPFQLSHSFPLVLWRGVHVPHRCRNMGMTHQLL